MNHPLIIMTVNIHWRPDGVPSLGAKPARCSDHSGAVTAECTNHYYTLLALSLLSLLIVADVFVDIDAQAACDSSDTC